MEDNKKKVEKKEENTSLAKELRSYAITALIAVVLAYILNSTIIVNAQVTSGSMETTVMTGDRVIINRLAYSFGDPQRGDIIMFKCPDYPKEDWFKRVIGLPGETVTVADGKVYIDGTALEESYLTVVTEGTFGPYVVPEGHYFLMGDNRNDSNDSRYWKNPYVNKDLIVGKAVFDYFPKLRKLK